MTRQVAMYRIREAVEALDTGTLSDMKSEDGEEYISLVKASKEPYVTIKVTDDRMYIEIDRL